MKRRKVLHWTVVMTFNDGTTEELEGDNLADGTSSEIDEAIKQAGYKTDF